MKFQNLPVIKKLENVFQKEALVPVPETWYIAITDVKGSTKAIESGRYKEVNIAGGLSIMALANAFEDMNFPFVFGGDGVTILIPEETIENACDVLYDAKLQIEKLYNLELRVGIVPVQELYQKNHIIQYGKLEISQYYNQVIIYGEGIDIAEDWVKAEGSTYLLQEKKNPQIEADFSGFTCRWEDIPSHKGEAVALIVKANAPSTGHPSEYYKSLIPQIFEIIGDVSEHHPIQTTHLEQTKRTEYLKNEAKSVTKQESGLKYWLKYLNIRLEVFITRLALKFNLKIKAFWYQLNELKEYQVLSSDYRKYDGTLKMIISVSKEARENLETYLQKEKEQGNLFYGLHVSDKALMTCLLHSGTEREVHFVDGGDGGYALAAKMLKAQIRKT
ncbi:MAG: DUF3095 domain-containing protein [Spirochaetota bacterium]